MKSVQWIRTLTEEEAMKGDGIKWDVVNAVRLADIDWELSLKNMGRLKQPLDEKLVQDYATAMLNGAAFPMIVLQKMKNGKYRILSGNHRGRAAQSLGEKELAAYVVKSGEEQELEIFARTINSKNGEPPDRDEKIQQAITLVEVNGYSNKEAAKRVGLKETTLNEARRAKEVKNLLVNLGVNNAEKLATGTLLKLHTVADNHNALRHAGELVTEYEMPVDEVSQMAKQIRQARTEAQKIGAVGEWEEKCRKQKVKKIAGGIPLKTRTKLLRWLNQGVSLFKTKPTKKLLQLTPEEVVEVRNTCTELLTKLSTILK